jgi:hypothetical protein
MGRKACAVTDCQRSQVPAGESIRASALFETPHFARKLDRRLYGAAVHCRAAIHFLTVLPHESATLCTGGMPITIPVTAPAQCGLSGCWLHACGYPRLCERSQSGGKRRRGRTQRPSLP